MTSEPLSAPSRSASSDDPVIAPHTADGADLEDPPEPPRLRRLRRLVTLLLIVLIVGVSTVVIALLIKLKEIRFEAPAPLDAAEASGAERAIPGLRPGERLVEARAEDGRVLLMLEDPAGARRAVILDASTFQPIAAFTDDPGGAP